MQIKYISLILFVALLTVIFTAMPLSTNADGEMLTSIDTMKESKDSYYNPLTSTQMDQVCQLTSGMSVSHIAISTPYDFPDYLRQWVQAVRRTGKKVWFRSTWSRWEGIYVYEGNPTMTPSEYNNELRAFILSNSDLFQSGDIFDPCPEPEQPMGNPNKLGYWERTYGTDWTWRGGGYNDGTTAYSNFFVDVSNAASQAFADAGISGVRTDVRSVNDWIAGRPETLYQSAASQMGVLTVDLYPSQDCSTNPITMLNSFKDTLVNIHNMRNVPVIVGEFGYSIQGQPFVRDEKQQAIIRPILDWIYNTEWIQGFNYWHGAGYPAPDIYNGAGIFKGDRGAWVRRPAADDMAALFESFVTGAHYPQMWYDFEDWVTEGWQSTGMDGGPWLVTEWRNHGEYSIKYSLTLRNSGAWTAYKQGNFNFSGKSGLSATVARSTWGNFGNGPTARLYVRTGSSLQLYTSPWVALTTGGSNVTLDLGSVSNISDVREIGIEFATSNGTTAEGAAAFIDNVTLLSNSTVPTPTPGAPVKYESENATLSGGTVIANDHTGYSGTGFVSGYWALNSCATFTVNTPSAGSRNVTIRYANSMGGTQQLSIYVNGVYVRKTTFGNLANWDTWGDKTEALNLNNGSNTIALKLDNGDNGNVNINYIRIQ